MHISPLTAANAMAYKALMLHAYEHAADSFTSTPQERSFESDIWWRRRIDDPSGLTWVWGAFAGAELVGRVAVEYAAKTKTRHKGLIVAMFVHEHCRGQGLARKLMRAAISKFGFSSLWCKAHGRLDTHWLPVQGAYVAGFEDGNSE